MGSPKKLNKIKQLKKLSRKLLPVRPTTVIKNRKHILLNEAIELAEKEEMEEWKKE